LSDILPLSEWLPIVRPKAADELAIWYFKEAHVRQTGALPKILADHFASVADYWEHKRRHPDTRAGAMVALYSWTRCIAVAASVMTLNPIIVAVALSVAKRPNFRRALT
jgi:hypothetical protein